MSVPVKVAIVEDDEGLRLELQELVSDAPGFRCTRTYPDAESALREIPARPPDVILMDINLPGMSGIECVRRLKQALSGLRVIMLTVYEDSDTLFNALQAGADGYILKRTPRSQLLQALRELCAGGAPMSGAMARKVIGYFQQIRQTPAPARSPAQGPADMQDLTSRELEVLSAIARGLSDKEIAQAFGIANDTVRKHLQRVYDKLHVHTRTEAALKYVGKS
ncbi:MAG: response regulator transcription factor [bacterium]